MSEFTFSERSKKIFFIVVLAVFVLIFGWQFFIKKVEAGHKGVKVYLLGSSKGVDSEELGVGWHFIGINQELHTYPIYTQNSVWTRGFREGSHEDESITFQTKEGLIVNADFGITYRVDPDKVSVLFETFRRGVKEITNIFLRNIVRDAINKYASSLTIEAVYGVGKSELMERVQSYVSEEVRHKGIQVEKVYVIGEFRLPDQVKRALDAKIEATQRAEQRENEIRETEAEAKKLIVNAKAESESILLKAKAEAKANKIISSSITRTLVEYEKIKRWDGKLPQVSGSGTGLILDLSGDSERKK